MRLPPITAAVVLALSVPVDPVTAQSRRAPAPAPPSAPARDSAIDIPESMMPPAGKCRIWMLNVPAKQQPAATDCTTALRQKPANAVLVFGPAVRDLSPFEVRQLWEPRAAERDDARSRTADVDTPRRGEPDRKDSAAGASAQRVERRNAESRQAAPLGVRPTKADVRKPDARKPDVRTPGVRKSDVRKPDLPRAERRTAPPPTPAPKKPEKP